MQLFSTSCLDKQNFARTFAHYLLRQLFFFSCVSTEEMLAIRMTTRGILADKIIPEGSENVSYESSKNNSNERSLTDAAASHMWPPYTDADSEASSRTIEDPAFPAVPK